MTKSWFKTRKKR